MRIPARNNFDAVIKSAPHQRMYTASRYYSRLQRGPFIARLRIALRLLGTHRYAHLLDLGFGSGFFIPELSLHCERLYGIDLHTNVPAVKKMLAQEATKAYLALGDILHLPWKDASFDCVVCLSVLEFIEDMHSAIKELARVASPGATILIGAPVSNKVTDFCYDKLIRFSNHRIVHKSNHDKIKKAVGQYLEIEKVATYPFFLPFGASLFFVIKAAKRR